ncbi:16S rRNA (guanine(527)-N(7))-methyltransferase RsmG [Limoniibacter endophyticus]|uniref:Ribosomal RNA small subunit methyltransferase G n=1 Tax=Limoniibacter endophyticus TaxID=1565040 RepID=A0A8J3DNL7_9HYPH|nr:16S rRNA (guanine(527)-N(7))-methyltransferase RsmG [Limoniibacter endophyticus]GHC74367.1 ribosomal RNA small subunit methyltransferase G [Limoniibacter endophyticus]
MSDQKLKTLEEAAGPVSRETFARLVKFEELFKHWNRSINLVAPSTVNALWDRHIVDSAQLYPHISGAMKVVDLGTGGGFPGLILSILSAQNSDREFYFIESNRKKASFLTLSASALGVNAVVFPHRIEDTYEKIPRVDMVTARALAPLDVLLELSSPWLKAGASALFLKGREYRSEIEKSRQNWRFDLIQHQSVTNEESVALLLSNVRNCEGAGGSNGS